MPTRALVLGGGGPVGIAWETGLAAGLTESGVDVSQADLIIGTSAGSAVGAQLAMGRTPQQMFAAVSADAGSSRPGPTRANTGEGGAPPNLLPLMELMQKSLREDVDPTEVRKELGAFALQAKTMSEEQFIATFGKILATSEGWPAKKYTCTAVDALTGEFQAWGNDSGVPLSRAVASSCSVPGVYPPITINGRRYIDGGMRSATNADLAKGYETVIVVAVTSNVEGPMADVSRKRLEAELDVLRDSGSAVVLVTPDADSRQSFGPNLMDFTRRGGAAEAGLAQGRAEAARLSGAW
ncbi:MAG: patatin-like phospholipase family protein [bacterium]